MKYVRVWNDETKTEELVPLGSGFPGQETLGGIGGVDPFRASLFATRQIRTEFDWARAYGRPTPGALPFIGVAPNTDWGLLLDRNTSLPECNNWTFPGKADYVSYYTCEMPGLYHVGGFLRVVLSVPLADILLIKAVSLSYQIYRHPQTVHPYTSFLTGPHTLDAVYAGRTLVAGGPPHQADHLRAWGLSGSDVVPLFPGDRIIPLWRHDGGATLAFADLWESRFYVCRVGDVLLPDPICCE